MLLLEFLQARSHLELELLLRFSSFEGYERQNERMSYECSGCMKPRIECTH